MVVIIIHMCIIVISLIFMLLRSCIPLRSTTPLRVAYLNLVNTIPTIHSAITICHYSYSLNSIAINNSSPLSEKSMSNPQFSDIQLLSPLVHYHIVQSMTGNHSTLFNLSIDPLNSVAWHFCSMHSFPRLSICIVIY
jgi:hypothetical protein